MIPARRVLCSMLALGLGCAPRPSSLPAPTPSDSEGQSEVVAPGASPEKRKTPESVGVPPEARGNSPPPSEHLAPTPVEPKSPFRQVLKEQWGSTHEYKGRRLWLGKNGISDLSTGEALSTCQDARGQLMSGKDLYFAARLSPFSACPDEPMLLQHVGRKWKLRRYIDAHDLLMSEWIHSTTIAAVVPSRWGPPWGYELIKVAGNGRPPQPRRVSPSSKQKGQDEPRCYTVLQNPTGLHTFSDGTIMVVGESSCSSAEELEELSEEEERARYLPVIESFPAGRAPSTITPVPIEAVLHSLASADGDLWILGKQSPDFPRGIDDLKRQFFHFDGSNLEQLSPPPSGAYQLLEGPRGGSSAQSHSLWVLTQSELRPLTTEGDALLLPPECSQASAWFQDEHAWIVCEDGLYTTDPEQETLTFATEPGDCKDLNPRPQYSVPGLYKRASQGGACGRGRRSSKSKTNPNLPQPRKRPRRSRPSPRISY